MKKFVITGMALVAMLAVAALAFGQATPVVTVTGKVTPTSGGTKKKPKNGTVEVKANVNPESNVTVDVIRILIPEKIKLSGEGFRYCTKTQMDAAKSDSVCPTGSLVGTGSAKAHAGSAPFTFNIKIYAASKAGDLALRLTGSLTKVLEGQISPSGSPYGQQITIDVPQDVQQPVGGLYSSIDEITAKLGPANGKVKRTVTVKKNGKKRKVKKTFKTNFVNVLGCPADRTHDVKVRFHFVNNPNPPATTDAEGGAVAPCNP